MSVFLFDRRPFRFRPQAAHVVHDMPNLSIADLALERRHVLFGAVADTRKNLRGRRAVLPGVGVREIGGRGAGEIAAVESLAVLVVALDAAREVILLPLRDRFASVGERPVGGRTHDYEADNREP